MPKQPRPGAALGIAEILAQFRPREATATVCLAGDLAGEHARLEAELAGLAKQWQPSSLAEVDPRQELARRIADVEEQMKASEVTFQFRALPRQQWSDLLAAHPGRTTRERYNPDTLGAPLLAACCAEPEMTEEQATQLLDMLNEGQTNALLDAAYTVNAEALVTPFSQPAFVTRTFTAEK